MADSNKNILITPATGTTSEPKIEFTGYDANTISLNVLDDGTLSIEGSAGQLFSVSDSLTGTIFSVNDISGIPSIEVIDDGTITLAEYSGNVGIGTSSPTSKLDVAGTVNATSFVKSGGTSSQFLKADGSVDSTAYTTNTGTVTSVGVSAGNGLTGGGTITTSGTATLNVGAGSYVTVAADTVSVDATSANTASKVVARDASGNFSAGTITAALSGNANTATAFSGTRTVSLTGDVTGSTTTWTGSGALSIATTIAPNSVALGTDTTGNYVSGATAGTGISVTGTAGEGWSPTITNTAPNVTTNITTTHATTSVTVNSSDGTNGTINAATTSLAGVMTNADKTKLDGIEAGATGDMTASEILTAIKTVDGSGSGLDADTLDGVHASQFLRSDVSDTFTGTLTVNGTVNATSFVGDGSQLTGISVPGVGTTIYDGYTQSAISLTGDGVYLIVTNADSYYNNIIWKVANGLCSGAMYYPRAWRVSKSSSGYYLAQATYIPLIDFKPTYVRLAGPGYNPSVMGILQVIKL